MREHDSEPVHGLPEQLPEGESILWQGAPRWTALARRAFHIRKIAVYFGLLITWRIVAGISDGDTAGAIAFSSGGLLLLAVAAIGILLAIAYLIERSTVYTITNRRLVLRFGIAVPMSFNLPFSVVNAADVKLFADGTGDISVSLNAAGRIAYLVLWPHARPWRVSNPQPMLRVIPDAAAVAETLGTALSMSKGAQPASTRSGGIDRSRPAATAAGPVATAAS